MMTNDNVTLFVVHYSKQHDRGCDDRLVIGDLPISELTNHDDHAITIFNFYTSMLNHKHIPGNTRVITHLIAQVEESSHSRYYNVFMHNEYA